MKTFFLTLLLLLLINTKIEAQNSSELDFNPEINNDELTKFIEDWPQFVSWAEKKGENIAGTSNDLEATAVVYSSAVIKWIEKKNWIVDRFFYVERRINSVIRSCLIKEEQEKVTFILSKKLEELKAVKEPSDAEKAMMSSISEEVKKAKAAPYIFGIGDNELNLVCPIRAKVEAIL